MEIKGRQLRVNGYLTTNDLEMGEVFIFLDDPATLWMVGDNDVCVNLGNGETCYPYEYEDDNKPVRRIKCHLEVEGFA